MNVESYYEKCILNCRIWRLWKLGRRRLGWRLELPALLHVETAALQSLSIVTALLSEMRLPPMCSDLTLAFISIPFSSHSVG